MKLYSKSFLGGCIVIGLTTLGFSARATMNLANLPLWFEANHDQTETSARFTAHGADSEIAITPTQTRFILHKSSGATASYNMQLVGANPSAAISGISELSGKINYLLGNNPAHWQSGVPTFGRIGVEQVYPGVNVVYYGTGRQLEYDFTLAAGVNPGVIALRFNGAEKISIDPQGALIVSLPGGEVIQHQPVIYQNIGAVRRELSGGYKMIDAQTVGFAIGSYDSSQPLVIDPILSFSSYFGGNADETALGVAVDANGFIYVAGKTLSSSFSNNVPWSTGNACQTNFHGGTLTGDAFVAKFDHTGTNLVYLTYLGGSGEDGADGVAVDAQGNAYVGGYTSSPDFPTTNIWPNSGLSTNISGTTIPGFGYPTDGFIAELNTNGSRLLYSGLLGGSQSDAVMGIAVDSGTGTAYVTGYTYSTNFPCTANALSKKLACPYSHFYNANAFVAKIAPGGTNLSYSSYLGGTNFDSGRAIAFNNGLVFVAGYTASTNFPTTNAIAGNQFLNASSTQTNIGASDAFVTAFTNAASTNLTLLYSTYLGGLNNDSANGIAADAAGNAYVVGWTASGNFPYQPATNLSFSTNLTSFVHTNLSGTAAYATNAFLTQINWNGTNASIGYSAMFGGNASDIATAVAVAPDGNVFVTGDTTSTNFPIVNVATNSVGVLGTNSGLSDVFVIAFTNSASKIIYSTYLGGMDNDYAYGIAVDPMDVVYLTGQTISTNFPMVSARQTFRNGTSDTFLAKIAIAPSDAPRLVLTPHTGSTGTVQPRLAGPPPPSSLTLTWHTFPPIYTLESSINPSAAGSWMAVPGTATYINGSYNVTIPATNGVQFFRLRQQ